MENEKKSSKARIIICGAITAVIFLCFIARLFDWQILSGEQYREISVLEASYTERSDATRGEILDVNGVELAANKTTYNIVINKIYVQSSQLNSVIASLISLSAQCGVEYTDVLPIVVSSDRFAFTTDSNSELEYIKGESLLSDSSLSTADEIMDALSSRYEANDIADMTTRRNIISVRYNMEKTGYSYSNVYVFASDISSEAVAVVSERMQNTPSVEIRTKNERVINNGTLAPHILGVVGKLNEQEYEENKDNGYSLDDVIGKFGIESAMEKYLRGKAGTKTITKDENGNVVSETQTEKASPGNTVYLTLEQNVQAVADYSLAKNISLARKAGEQEQKDAEASNAKQQSKYGEDCYCGGAVMLSVKDFSVIAAASCPNYDLSKYGDSDYYSALTSNEHSPLYSRAFNGSFAPGSSFKPCVALAALQEGIITNKTEINCTQHYDYYPDYVVNCMGHHGTLTLNNAISLSCNYFFAEVGRRVGATTMYLYAEKFGLGVKTGLETSESIGVLAGRDSTTWYEGNTVQAAIGQSDNTFTPVQLATYVATIANNGVRYKTHLVRKITDYERKNTVFENDPDNPTVLSNAGISKKNMKLVQNGMRAVVTSGTASSVVSSYPKSVAAKTGTAENSGSDHVIFICYAPFDKPEIAVAVVLEHGAKGRYAMYTAMDMMDAYFRDKTVSDMKKSGSWG